MKKYTMCFCLVLLLCANVSMVQRDIPIGDDFCELICVDTEINN